MLVKRYHAKDMQQAMDTVVKELGSDAVILNSRKVRKKGFKNLFRKPILEIMVAYDPSNVPAVKRLNSAYGGFGANIQSTMQQSSQSNIQPTIHPPTFSIAKKEQEGRPAPDAASSMQIDRLDKRIDSIDAMLTEFVEKFSFVKREITYDFPEDVQELHVQMIENQVRVELAHTLAKETELMLRKQPGTNAGEVLEHLILEQFGKAEPILHKKFTQKVILVLGPTGVGKTTSIVKLAADFSIKQKKKVGMINTDTFRIGAQEQLQTYADILGIPLHVIYHPDELDEALEAMSDRDLIFVDTAGKRPGDEQHKEDILNLIRVLRPEDILLCIAATTGFASIVEMIDTYGFVDGYKLMVTKLDETKYRGVLLNISWYTNRPIAYVTTGQNVPDDIEVIEVETVTKQIIYSSDQKNIKQDKYKTANTPQESGLPGLPLKTPPKLDSSSAQTQKPNRDQFSTYQPIRMTVPKTDSENPAIQDLTQNSTQDLTQTSPQASPQDFIQDSIQEFQDSIRGFQDLTQNSDPVSSPPSTSAQEASHTIPSFKAVSKGKKSDIIQRIG